MMAQPTFIFPPLHPKPVRAASRMGMAAQGGEKEGIMFVTHGLSVVVIFWAAIAFMVLVTSFFSYRAQASHHRMIEKLAEKGQPIPPELLAGGGHDSRRYRSPIQSGIFLMCIGVALAVFFWAMGGGGAVFDGNHMPNWLPVIGIFPFMVGFARLLGGLFDRRP
jgi:Domain of unknown function (DUF6249)